MTSNREANGSPAHDTSGAGSDRQESGELRETIEAARERLGHTIEELAAELDVKGQAQAKAVEATAHLHDTTAGIAAQAQKKAAQAAHAAQTAGVQAKEQLTHVVAALSETVQDRAPERVQAALDRTGRGGRTWLPWAVAGVAGGALAGLVACRWAAPPAHGA